MSEIQVRIVDPRSRPIAERIDELQKAAYAQEAALLGVTHFPPLDRTVEDLLTAKGTFFAGVKGDSFVGVLAIEPAGQGSATISSLVVSPSQQRQGTASRLLAAALKANPASRVKVSTGAKNLPALRLYARFGFVEARRFVVGPESLEIVELLLERATSSGSQAR